MFLPSFLLALALSFFYCSVFFFFFETRYDFWINGLLLSYLLVVIVVLPIFKLNIPEM